MSELAFNVSGEPFEVPAAASGWRVRRLKPKGAPEVVYGRDGLPLVLPIDAGLDELRREVDAPGRYRMDPVDDTNRPIAAAPAGYVFIHPGERATNEPEPENDEHADRDTVVIEALRMNTELARSVIDRFPQMLEAAATLLRAADGAGLPARPGMAVEDQSDDQEREPEKTFDLNTLIAQIVPLVVAGISGKKVPPIASLLDWRKAKPDKAQIAAQASDRNTPATIEPGMMAHFVAVQSALTPEEATLARQLASELSPEELRAWCSELSGMSVADAAVKIRGVLRATGGAA